MLSPLSSKKRFFPLFFFQTFKEFLKEVVNMNMKLWKFSKSQLPKLLGFGKYGKTLFKTIVELVIAYHTKRKFFDHLLGKFHFFPDLRQICYIWGIISWVFNYFADFFLYIQYLFAYHIFFYVIAFFFSFFFITYKHTITCQIQNY